MLGLRCSARPGQACYANPPVASRLRLPACLGGSVCSRSQQQASHGACLRCHRLGRGGRRKQSQKLSPRAASSLYAGSAQPEEWPTSSSSSSSNQQLQPTSSSLPSTPPPPDAAAAAAAGPAAPAYRPQQAPSRFQLWSLGSPVAWGFMLGYIALMLVLPIAALLTKASRIPLDIFWARATEPVALSAYYVSFSVAIAAGLINAVFGFILAWVLVKFKFPGKKWIDAAVDLPFALPTSVAGLTLATVYSDEGLIGGLLTRLGVDVVFTRLGVAVAMVFVSFPFVVRTMQPVLQEMEKEVEEAAWALGASPWATFTQVLLPPLLPPLLTGTALAFSRALGEFGSIVIVSSNFPFKDLIAPVLIFQCLEQYDYVGATVIGTVLLMISLTMMVGVNWLQSYAQRFKK